MGRIFLIHCLQDMLILIQTGQHFPRTARNTGQGIIHQKRRQSRRRTYCGIQSAQQRPTASHCDTQIRNVGRQFRRCQFQCLAYSIDDFRHRLRQCGRNLGFGDNRFTRRSGQQIAPLYFHCQFVCLVLGRKAATRPVFDIFAPSLSNQHSLVVPHKVSYS